MKKKSWRNFEILRLKIFLRFVSNLFWFNLWSPILSYMRKWIFKQWGFGCFILQFAHFEGEEHRNNQYLNKFKWVLILNNTESTVMINPWKDNYLLTICFPVLFKKYTIFILFFIKLYLKLHFLVPIHLCLYVVKRIKWIFIKWLFYPRI